MAGHIEITVTVPETVSGKFKAAFLRKKPVPLDGDGNPVMTDKAWVKRCIEQYLIRIYRKGQRQIAVDNVDQGEIFE
jgi:hypothetical protein